MAYTKVTGALVGSLSDLDLTNVGDIQLDSISGDSDTNTSITFSGSDVITIATGGSGRLTIGDGALSPVTDNQIDLGTSSLEFKDAFFDGTVTADAFAGDITGTVTGTATGLAGTPNIAVGTISTTGALTLGDYIEKTSGNLTIDVAGDIILDADGGDHYFKDGGTTLMHLTPTALGVGVTPEGAYSAYTSIEFGQQGAIFANDAADDFGFKVNTYLDSGGNWKRKETGVASALDMDGDQIKIFTAASGSADANISFAQKFRLDNDGLKFGTDTAAANALNDYEEGDWSPQLVGTTGSAGTYATSATTGKYTKVGNRVFFNCTFYVTNKGSYTGKSVITGLPFTNNGSTTAVATGSFPDSGYGTTSGNVLIVGQVEAANSRIIFYDGSRLDPQHDFADVGTGYYVNVAGNYMTNS